MKLILCVDDEMGIAFANKRQSKDKYLCENIAALSKDASLLMNTYSGKMFLEYGLDDMIIADDFLKYAKNDDFCFAENNDFTEYLTKIDEIVLYRWNRHYGADEFFDPNILQDFRMYAKRDFVGFSHDTITEERYKRWKE